MPDNRTATAACSAQGSSFLTISLFWRGFLATCTCTVVLHVLAFMKARRAHSAASLMGRWMLCDVFHTSK